MLLVCLLSAIVWKSRDTYDQGKGLTELVGTVRRSGGVGTGQLVQHPRGGSVQALKVVLGSANHCEMGDVRLQMGRSGDAIEWWRDCWLVVG